MFRRMQGEGYSLAPLEKADGPHIRNGFVYRPCDAMRSSKVGDPPRCKTWPVSAQILQKKRCRRVLSNTRLIEFKPRVLGKKVVSHSVARRDHSMTTDAPRALCRAKFVWFLNGIKRRVSLAI